jgi:hypothetical protein
MYERIQNQISMRDTGYAGVSLRKIAMLDGTEKWNFFVVVRCLLAPSTKFTQRPGTARYTM